MNSFPVGYIQYIIDGIWTDFLPSDNKEVNCLGVLYVSRIFAIYRNAKRNWQRIQEHFFFATFHPLKDYSLEASTKYCALFGNDFLLLCCCICNMDILSV